MKWNLLINRNQKFVIHFKGWRGPMYFKNFSGVNNQSNFTSSPISATIFTYYETRKIIPKIIENCDIKINDYKLIEASSIIDSCTTIKFFEPHF